MWTREEQSVIDKIETGLFDEINEYIAEDRFLNVLEENDLSLSEALFILYEAGHIKFPDYFEIDRDG